MKDMISKRLLASVGVALGSVALSACGTQASGSQSTVVDISKSQYVKKPVATTPPATTAPPGGPAIREDEQLYTVQAGDYFAKIAERYGTTIDKIVQYNDFGSKAHLLSPGDIVKIPPNSKNGDLVTTTLPASTTLPAAGATGDAATGDSATGAGCEYTIASGDNPTKVAKKFKITYDELKAANSESVMSTFLVGAKLTIPPQGKCG